ncbi:MAG: hypothetical protein ACOX2P_04100 [Bacillota bacterium]
MNKRIIAAIVLVVSMFAAAEFVGDLEIIFPEISALAVGAWVMEKTPWKGPRINFWLSPTLAAFTGMAILKIFPYNSLLMITATLFLVIVQIELLNSEVFPSISAAILPIIVQANSWIYPISVCIMAGIIACGKAFLDKTSGLKEKADSVELDIDSNQKVQNSVKYWLKISAAVILIAAAALNFDVRFILAPPLIVVFIELTQPHSLLREKPVKVLLLIVLAALSGVLWLVLVVEFLNLPLWVFSILAMAWLFMLYHWIGVQLPPAGAITLLPAIVPVESLFWYPLQVTFGCILFIIISLYFFSRREYNVTEEEADAVDER